MKRKHFVWIIIIWSLIIITSWIWNFSLLQSNNRKVVLNKSRAFFVQITTSRAWNSQHGGVYVPVTPTTQPNPYLIDSLRDLVTVDGMQLTKINPAYMTRQIAEINKINNKLFFHITSLSPVRPENKADKWETKALNSFRKDTTEFLELVRNDSISQYRYMAPLITEKSCLKCHGQNYKLGDIRGGISVSYDAGLYITGITKQALSEGIYHLLFFSLGIIGLIIYYRMSNNYYSIIKNKNSELLKINSTKDKFFSIIAHDLKSPFNIILGYSDLLKSKYDDFTSDERKDFINEIDTASKRTFTLLENLLLWARSQTNKIEIVKENLNLKKVVIESIDAYKPGTKKKNISLVIDIPDMFFINADKFTMSTVIANLFSNAIKFTPINGNIKIEVSQMDKFLEISISDSGVGIPPEIIPGLFLPGESVSTLGTDNEKGSGLGLLLCKEFVEKNGGKITVESEVGKGTNIKFTVPEYLN